MNKNKAKYAILAMATITLFGCSGSQGIGDLDKWMEDAKKSQVGKIKDLPKEKEFTPVTFLNPLDPFKEKPVLALLVSDKYAPDFSRRKEQLETYALNNLKMTGVIIKSGVISAMIESDDGRTHYVKKGNYMGQNYGQIKEVTESKIVLEERVKDAAGDWSIKPVNVELVEAIF